MRRSTRILGLLLLIVGLLASGSPASAQEPPAEEPPAEALSAPTSAAPTGPPGTVTEVCVGAPLPNGWVTLSTRWDPFSCGNPGSLAKNVVMVRHVAPADTLQQTCQDSPIPNGWTLVDDIRVAEVRCGGFGLTMESRWTLGRWDHLPVGATMEVCLPRPPPGWQYVSGRWDPTRCGQPAAIGNNLHTIRRVTGPVQLDYVSLGDSYSSGLGIGAPYKPQPAGCDQHPNAYPDRLARSLDALAELVVVHTPRACAGATTSTMPIDPAPRPDVELVTITIGGNDVGFETTLRACHSGDCVPLLSDAEITRRLEGTPTVPGLRQLLTAQYYVARARYPNAGIVVLTYPNILPPTVPGPLTCPSLWSFISQAELDRLHVFWARTNQVIRQVTANVALGLTRQDVEGAFGGHDICSTQPFANSLYSGAVGRDSFHPNGAGHRQLTTLYLQRWHPGVPVAD